MTDADIKAIEDAALNMAKDALRVLALAVKYDDDSASEENLIFRDLSGCRSAAARGKGRDRGV